MSSETACCVRFHVVKVYPCLYPDTGPPELEADRDVNPQMQRRRNVDPFEDQRCPLSLPVRPLLMKAKFHGKSSRWIYVRDDETRSHTQMDLHTVVDDTRKKKFEIVVCTSFSEDPRRSCRRVSLIYLSYTYHIPIIINCATFHAERRPDHAPQTPAGT
jgi:hypothetical protein